MTPSGALEMLASAGGATPAVVVLLLLSAVVFASARSAHRSAHRSGWAQRLRLWRPLQRGWRAVEHGLGTRWAPGVVVLSGFSGLPPLFALAAAAGAAGMPLRSFAATCLLGRTARLVLLALSPELALRLL